MNYLVSSTGFPQPVSYTHLNQAVVSGVYPEPRYAWRIKTEIEVQFVGEKDFIDKKLAITMTIIRVSTLNAPRGIGIEQIIVEDLK